MNKNNLGITEKFDSHNLTYNEALNKLNEVYSILKLRADIMTYAGVSHWKSSQNYDCCEILGMVLEPDTTTLLSIRTNGVSLYCRRRWRFICKVLKNLRIRELSELYDKGKKAELALRKP
jgi:hypothetical protein